MFWRADSWVLAQHAGTLAAVAIGAGARQHLLRIVPAPVVKELRRRGRGQDAHPQSVCKGLQPVHLHPPRAHRRPAAPGSSVLSLGRAVLADSKLLYYVLVRHRANALLLPSLG